MTELTPTTRSARSGRRIAIALTAALAVSGAWGAPQANAAPAPAAPVMSVSRIADPAGDLALTARRLIAKGINGDTRAMLRYTVVRNQLATTIANRVGVSPAALRGAWKRATLKHQQALMAALSQLGVPYRSMQSREWEGFDCSGLTYFAWGTAGVALNRSSGSQIAAAAARTQQTAQAGDLVQYPGHVMMYLGVGNAVVHSPYTGRWVEVYQVSRSVRFGNPIA